MKTGFYTNKDQFFTNEMNSKMHQQNNKIQMYILRGDKEYELDFDVKSLFVKRATTKNITDEEKNMLLSSASASNVAEGSAVHPAVLDAE